MMRKIRWAILILGALVLITVMVQNSHAVTLKLLRYETQLPASTLLLATSVLSFLIGVLSSGRMLGRRTPRARRDAPSASASARPS